MPEPPGRPSVRQAPIRWGPSAHARRLLTLGLAGLALAVGTGRPEFAGLAAPALLLLAALRPGRPAQLAVRVAVTEVLVVEGLQYIVSASIGAPGSLDAELWIEPAEDILVGPAVTVAATAHRAASAAGTQSAADASVPAGRLTQVQLPFTPQRWGNRQIGRLRITLRDRYRLTEGTLAVHLPRVDCRPLPAELASSIVLSRLPSRLGEHRARATGDGAEFAGVREFVPGDRQRRINWPATTRLGTVHLSTFAAERTQNLVVIADTTADVGESGASSVDLVLRGAAGVITRYLTARDRVGLIMSGGRLDWLAPSQGQRHCQRLLDLLVSSQGGWERTAELARLPRAALPPGALILVFTPLLDPRLIESVRDLRERGFIVLIVDVLNAEPGHDSSRISGLAVRLWRLEQQAIRYSLTQIGVPVVHWDGISSLDVPLAPYSRRVMVVHR